MTVPSAPKVLLLKEDGKRRLLGAREVKRGAMWRLGRLRCGEVVRKGLRKEAVGKGLREPENSLNSWYAENFSMGEKKLLTESDIINENKGPPRAGRKTDPKTLT